MTFQELKSQKLIFGLIMRVFFVCNKCKNRTRLNEALLSLIKSPGDLKVVFTHGGCIKRLIEMVEPKLPTNVSPSQERGENR